MTLYETVTDDSGVAKTFLALPTERVVVEVGCFGLTRTAMEDLFFAAMDAARIEAVDDDDSTCGSAKNRTDLALRR